MLKIENIELTMTLVNPRNVLLLLLKTLLLLSGTVYISFFLNHIVVFC